MFYLGLDLGRIRDPSALVAVERIDHRRAFLGSSFDSLLVRYARRMPLGMPYPRVVERVRAVVRSEELLGNCVLAVDGTGVGAPVVDMLSAARLGCEVCAVTITGGERGTLSSRSCALGQTAWSVPKQDLLAGLQVLLDEGRLKIAPMKETGRLVEELVNVKRTVNGSGRVRLGADGYGEHDDLAIALALACWCAQRRQGDYGEGTRRLPGI